MADAKVNIGQAVSFGWEKTKANFWLMVGIALVLMVIGIVPGMIFTKSFVLGSNLLTWILGSIFGVGLIKILLKIYDNKPVAIEDFFSLTMNQFLDYLLASLMLIVITFVGLILLIIPGIIFSLKYQFTLWLILDKNLRPMAALKESNRITKGHLWNLFLLWLLSILIIIAGCLVFGVGALVAVPVVILAQTYVYKSLVK